MKTHLNAEIHLYKERTLILPVYNNVIIFAYFSSYELNLTSGSKYNKKD